MRLPGRLRMYWQNYLSGRVGVGQECSHPPNCLDPDPDKKWKMEHPSMFFFNCHLLLIGVKSGSFPSGGSNSARICHQSIILTWWQIIGLWQETGLQKRSELEMNPEPSCYSAPVCILRV